MNDTVTKLMALVDDAIAASHEINHDYTITRQALQDELVRLFTPLTDEQIEAVSERVAVDDYAHDLTRRVEKAH